MIEFPKNYIIEVDTVDKDSWHKIINNFCDANIYQTWPYDEIRFGNDKISHLILKKDNKIVGAAQVRIVKIPVINAGIAYIYWGPLWKNKNTEIDKEHFSLILRALRNEYSHRRGLLLRIYPALFSDDADKYLSILNNEGFKPFEKEDASRTLLIDLTPDLDTIRKGLKQKWRNCLNRALKNNIELLEGYSDEMFEMFIGLYREMLDRKKFVESNDINEFKKIQKNLPDACKMKIMLCHFQGKLCAGAIFSSMGSTGLYLFGAMNEIGMRSNGSYLMQWKFIEWLKKNNFSCYDLNGINPVINPGTYKFKEGLCGKNGKDVYFLGKFEVCENKISEFAMKYGDSLLSNYKITKATVHNICNVLHARFKIVK